MCLCGPCPTWRPTSCRRPIPSSTSSPRSTKVSEQAELPRIKGLQSGAILHSFVSESLLDCQLFQENYPDAGCCYPDARSKQQTASRQCFSFVLASPALLRRYYPKEKGLITNIDPIGNSPVIIKKVSIHIREAVCFTVCICSAF